MQLPVETEWSSARQPKTQRHLLCMLLMTTLKAALISWFKDRNPAPLHCLAMYKWSLSFSDWCTKFVLNVFGFPVFFNNSFQMYPEGFAFFVDNEVKLVTMLTFIWVCAHVYYSPTWYTASTQVWSKPMIILPSNYHVQGISEVCFLLGQEESLSIWTLSMLWWLFWGQEKSSHSSISLLFWMEMVLPSYGIAWHVGGRSRLCSYL